MPRYLVKHYSKSESVCEGDFSMILTCEFVDGVKQIALPEVVGLTLHSADCLYIPRRLTLLQVRENSFCLTTELGYWPFHAFRLKLKHQLFLCLNPSSFQDGTTPIALLSVQLADWISGDSYLNIYDIAKEEEYLRTRWWNKRKNRSMWNHSISKKNFKEWPVILNAETSRRIGLRQFSMYIAIWRLVVTLTEVLLLVWEEWKPDYKNWRENCTPS